MRRYYYYDEAYGKFQVLSIDMVNYVGWYFRDYNYITDTSLDEDLMEWVKISLHMVVEEESCQHESDGLSYLSYPPQLKCIKCGEFYRCKK